MVEFVSYDGSNFLNDDGGIEWEQRKEKSNGCNNVFEREEKNV